MGLCLLDHFLLGKDQAWISLREAGRGKLLDLGEVYAGPIDDARSRVKPKYRNPDQPEQTWSGRGRMARWLREKIADGEKLEHFLVEE